MNKKRTSSRIDEAVISAGFGGQGIMVLGKALAEAGMARGLNVTYLPSYGAEVRGGTAHSMVRISSELIPSPVVNTAEAAIIMNEPSLDKFSQKVKKGGLLIVNTSMSRPPAGKKGLLTVAWPLTDVALELGNIRVANMVAAGIYAAKKGIFDLPLLVSVIEKMAGERKELIPVNVKALERGFSIAEEV